MVLDNPRGRLLCSAIQPLGEGTTTTRTTRRADPAPVGVYPTTVVSVRRHPSSRIARVVVVVDAPDEVLAVRRLIAATKAAGMFPGSTRANILDTGDAATTRFDVRLWLPTNIGGSA